MKRNSRLFRGLLVAMAMALLPSCGDDSPAPSCVADCEGQECGDDGCGGECGECEGAMECVRGQCQGEGCTPDCEGRECGDDGCDGECGECEGGNECLEGLCQGCEGDCADRECGDDGCGGSCGECASGRTCMEGLCQDCEADCEGRECGDDGCGGSCGECASGRACVEGVCQDCDCTDRECGDDGCGGSCGECASGRSCVEGLCQDCAADCEGRECGDDGCGGLCGECDQGYVCDGQGMCQEVGCSPQCNGKECGDNGCGGLCGECDEGFACRQGVCEETGCQPACGNRECGDNGCDGSCGECDEGFECRQGRCVEPSCTADCTDRECGDDGCEGLCGECDEGYICEEGLCIEEPCTEGDRWCQEGSVAECLADGAVELSSCPDDRACHEGACRLAFTGECGVPSDLPGFCLVGAGTFNMGSPATEANRYTDETLHEVTITRDYYMQATEVTQEEFSAVTAKAYWSGCPDCPAWEMNWYQAAWYTNMLSEMEGLETCYDMANCTGTVDSYLACNNVSFLGLDCEGYRLPTEAEWEYAARAGTQTPFHSGEMTTSGCFLEPALDEAGWYCGNSLGTSQPVAGKAPNAWGLYDVHGNVWEMVWDGYGDYPTGPVTDPLGAVVSDRVARGGSYTDEVVFCRAAYRRDLAITGQYLNWGFRVARTALP